jgi:hypothetical protein
LHLARPGAVPPCTLHFSRRERPRPPLTQVGPGAQECPLDSTSKYANKQIDFMKQAAGGRAYSCAVYQAPSGQTLVERWTIHGANHSWSDGSNGPRASQLLLCRSQESPILGRRPALGRAAVLMAPLPTLPARMPRGSWPASSGNTRGQRPSTPNFVQRAV